MSKSKYTNRGLKKRKVQKKGSLKPVLTTIIVCILMGAAFYLGTRYDSLESILTNKPDNAQNTPITGVPGNSQNTPITDKNHNIQVTESPTITNAPIQTKTVNLTLYFSNLNADAVVPTQRQVEIETDEKLEKVIFKELQKGPYGTGEDSTIPKDTKLLSADVKDGLCYLDLSREFVDNNPGGTAFETVLINSIVNSLTELPEIKKVQFLVEGEKREVYSHVIFDEPFERNESFIKKADSKSEIAKGKVREMGDKVLTALKDKNMDALSTYIHPDKGVRFSPYAYVEVEKDIVLSAEQIKEALDSEQLYIWGAYDGIGEPIELTFAEYIAHFVYNQDFLIADEVLFDQYFERGNTINNVFDAYANAHVLEYYYRGFNPDYEGMDWESLKLVFEQKDGKWYLTGVVHDQWTI
ncbi:MAG TPA: GerMN domain-containing protein [Thermoclostridium sp.]|nr:GerMN domain-containing protein [Thermoclostridium sp.]